MKYYFSPFENIKTIVGLLDKQKEMLDLAPRPSFADLVVMTFSWAVNVGPNGEPCPFGKRTD